MANTNEQNNGYYKLTDFEERFLLNGEGNFQELLVSNRSNYDKMFLLTKAISGANNKNEGPLAESYLFKDGNSNHNLYSNLAGLKYHFLSGPLAQTSLIGYYSTSLPHNSLDFLFDSNEISIEAKADLLSKSFFYDFFDPPCKPITLLENFLDNQDLAIGSKASLISSALIAGLKVSSENLEEILSKQDEISIESPKAIAQLFLVLSSDRETQNLLQEEDYYDLIKSLEENNEALQDNLDIPPNHMDF